MDELFDKQLDENHFQFKLSLDRIIEKYSKLQYQDWGAEVDLNDISSTGMTGNDASQLTVSSLDEVQRSVSRMELQPKDEDQELEMSVRSSGSSLVELYPNMIRRIERARHQQYVSMAADSVLRKYRRWRQQSNRRNLNNTFATLKQTNSKPKKMTTKTFLEKRSSSPMKRHFMRTKTTPVQIVTGLQDWQEPHRVPGKEKIFMTKQQHKPVPVMDLSASCEPSKPKKISLNKTFTVSQRSRPEHTQRKEQASAYMLSPSRPFAQSSNERLSLSLSQRAGSSVFAPEFTASIQRPDIYGSSVRQSPSKARGVASLGRSPFSRSPSKYANSREPTRPRSVTTSLASPTKKPVKRPYPQNPQHPQNPQQSIVPQLHSPRSATAASDHRRGVRHLSCDSSLPPNPASYTPQQLDEGIMRLYHKYVCQNKAPLFIYTPPCRLCLRNSQASRSEMLRQVISPSEVELPRGGGLSYSYIKRSKFQRSSSQQPAAHEEDALEGGSAEDFSDRECRWRVK